MCAVGREDEHSRLHWVLRGATAPAFVPRARPAARPLDTSCAETAGADAVPLSGADLRALAGVPCVERLSDTRGDATRGGRRRLF